MLRIGIIGCGFVAELHLAAFMRLQRAGHASEVVVAADALPGRAEALARRFAIPEVAPDYRSVLARDDIDAVCILTPNATHREVATAAAEAGKHIFVEKPIALTLTEADEIIAACASARVKLLVGQAQRFSPINREVKSLLQDGEIGKLVYIGVTNYDAYFWPGGWQAWQIDPTQSGGHLVQNGIHTLDLLCWLFEDVPQRLFARGAKIASEHLDTFDHYHIHLAFSGGSSAVATMGYSASPLGANFRSIYVLGESGEAHYETTGDGTVWALGGAHNRTVPEPRLFDRELEHWMTCIEDDEEPVVTPPQARLALELALAAEHSAHSGEVVYYEERPYA